MKYRPVIIIGLVAALAMGPVAPASAHGRFHGGPLLLPFVAVGAVVTGVAILATAPFRAVAQAATYNEGPRYAPQPQVYAAPPPGYYASYPVYYARPPAPQYYAAPPGYYAPPNY